MSPIIGLEPEKIQRLVVWQTRLAELPRWQRWALLGCGIFIPGMVIAAVAFSEPSHIVDPRAEVLVVTPFVPATPDTGLARLGRDLVITLSANLDGVGGIRAVDGPSVLAQVAGAAPSRAVLDDILRRVGASGAVSGTVTRVGSEAQLAIELAAVRNNGLGKRFARARVSAPIADPAALTDAATQAVLHAVWDEGDPPVASLSAVTTASRAALEAFLDGEQAAAVGNWDAAERVFGRAVAADSTFWLAYWRRAQALRRAGRPVPRPVLAAVREHRSKLPRREQLLVESEMAQGLNGRLAFLQDATRRFPDAGWSWYELGDVLVHDGPLAGYDYGQAQTALVRATGLLPGFAPAWSRLAWTYLMAGDTAGSRAALDGLIQSGATDAPDGAENRSFLMVADQALRGTLSDSLVDRLARHLAAARGSGAAWSAFAFTWLGYPAAQQRVSRRVLAVGVSPEVGVAQREGIAAAWAARGAWDSAVVELERVARSGGNAIAPYRLAVIGALVGALDPAWARSRGTALSRAGRPAAQVAELAWLDGVLATVTPDRSALEAANKRLAATSDSARVALQYSLRAFQAALDRDPRGAGRILARVEWELADEPWGSAEDHPALRAVDRLAGARWLIATGDTTQARRMLVGWQRWATGRGREPVLGWVLAPQALIELARLEIVGGRSDRAREYYAQFLRRYDRPMASQQALVDEARAALAAPAP